MVDIQENIALITGITGQDGSYLTELLLEKGYKVHGIMRRSSSFNTGRINHVYDHPNLSLHYGDLVDTSCLVKLLIDIQPTEIYNLAAQSHVKVSFELPEYTGDVDALGTLRVLEAIRISGLAEKTKFYQASTSELYGKVIETPQTETTPFYPRSPYAVAKLYSYWITVNYRESYKMFACNGILFNHESPRRGLTFVTRKITRAVARISKGLQEYLYLGQLNSIRDWGHSKDYVRGMWLILQQREPEDYVLGSGKGCTVREFVEKSFKVVGINIVWEGEGLEEVGKDAKTGKTLIRIDEKYFRPSEVDLLLSDPTKAKEKLSWECTYTLDQLIEEMVENDLKYPDRSY